MRPVADGRAFAVASGDQAEHIDEADLGSLDHPRRGGAWRRRSSHSRRGYLFFGPRNALFLALIILQPLISNTQPLAMFLDQIGDSDLSSYLEQKFPAGTAEDVVRMTLLNQGFKSPDPPPVDCLPQGEVAPVGRVIFPCPLHDPSKTLEYRWGRFPCGDTIIVWWSTGDSGGGTRVGGGHGHACL
jgi:hypothetical protein